MQKSFGIHVPLLGLYFLYFVSEGKALMMAQVKLTVGRGKECNFEYGMIGHGS